MTAQGKHRAERPAGPRSKRSQGRRKATRKATRKSVGVVPLAVAATITMSAVGVGVGMLNRNETTVATDVAALAVPSTPPVASQSRGPEVSRNAPRTTPVAQPTPAASATATPSRAATPAPRRTTPTPTPIRPAPRPAPAPRRPAPPPLPDWLASCNTGAQTTSAPNGQLPEEELCELPNGHKLRGDAALGYWKLSTAFEKAFGTEFCMTDSYRSYEAQVTLKAAKPGLAAQPGTSNHGWGIAVDLCGGIEYFDTEEHEWMSENAPATGWVNPEWAQETGSKPEAWHWEFAAPEGDTTDD